MVHSGVNVHLYMNQALSCLTMVLNILCLFQKQHFLIVCCPFLYFLERAEMFGLMFSSYVILISPIKFFSIMINHPKEIVSKIKDNLYLVVVFSPLLVIFTTPELVIFILTLLFNIIFFQRKRSHDNIFNRH